MKKEEILKYNPQITHADRIVAGENLIIPEPRRNKTRCTEIIPQKENQGHRVEVEAPQEPATPTEQKLFPEGYLSDGFKEAFLADDANVRMLIAYAKFYHSNTFKQIQQLSISNIQKKERLFELYRADHIAYGKRPYVRAIRTSQFDSEIAGRTESLLQDA